MQSINLEYQLLQLNDEKEALLKELKEVRSHLKELESKEVGSEEEVQVRKVAIISKEYPETINGIMKWAYAYVSASNIVYDYNMSGVLKKMVNWWLGARGGYDVDSIMSMLMTIKRSLVDYDFKDLSEYIKKKVSEEKLLEGEEANARFDRQLAKLSS